jgi:uncharacterized protein (TIGR03083 family)
MARVPSCPHWDVADLMRHVGGFHRYLTYLARLPDGAREAPAGWAGAVEAFEAVRKLGPDADLVSWLREGADDLSQALRDAHPNNTVPCSTGCISHGSC